MVKNINDLREVITAMYTLASSYMSEYEKLSKEKEKLQKDYNELKKNYDELLVKNHNEIVKLNTKLDSVNTQVKLHIENKLAEKHDMLRGQIIENSTQLENITNIVSDINNHALTIGVIKELLDALSTVNNNVASVYTKASDIAETLQKGDDLQKSIKDLQKNVGDLQESIKDLGEDMSEGFWRIEHDLEEEVVEEPIEDEEIPLDQEELIKNDIWENSQDQEEFEKHLHEIAFEADANAEENQEEISLEDPSDNQDLDSNPDELNPNNNDSGYPSDDDTTNNGGENPPDDGGVGTFNIDPPTNEDN